jgi:hypothetical protein
VDDQPRGEGGRNHSLVLPAGRHRITGQRLDDRRQVVVDVRPGETRGVDLNFD